MSPASRSPGGLSRDLDILEAIAQSTAHAGTGLRLTDLAEVTGREKSQLSRGLARLEEVGLVARAEDDRRFVLGWRLFHYAALTAEAHLVSLAQPAMRRIVGQLDETVHLCVLRGTSCVTLHSEVPRHGFRLSWMGSEAPAHTITAGRVLLAEWSDDELRSAYPPGRLPGTPPTGRVRTRSDLLRTCAVIRTHGYAVVDEEFETGLVGASAAVRDFRGVAVASLNIAAPKARLESKLEAAGEYIARAAHRLSAGLGYRGPNQSLASGGAAQAVATRAIMGMGS